MSKIQLLLEAMPIFQHTYPDDACILIANHETILGFLPGKQFDAKIRVGESMSKYAGTATAEAMRLGINVQVERDASVTGVAYISTATPIIEDGIVVGAISALVSNQKLDTLRKGTHELSATVEEMTASAERVSNDTTEISHNLQKISTQSKDMLNDIKQIDTVVRFVQEISDQSHLLGLNAAIEAARVGEQGRGFEVVANEIRKMAAVSKESAEQIKQQLARIQEVVKEMDNSIRQVSAYTRENSAGMEELNSAFLYIAKTAEELAIL